MSALGGLRPRVALLVVAVVALSLALAFATVYRATSAGLGARTDRDLEEDVRELEAAVVAESGTAGEALARAQDYVQAAPFRATARLVFVAGAGLAVTNQPRLLGGRRHGGPRPERGPPVGAGIYDPYGGPHDRKGGARAFLEAPEGFSQELVPGAGLVRMLVRDVSAGGEAVRLGVGTPVQPTDRAKDVVRQAFLVAALGALLAALAGGALVAHRVVAPLRRLGGVATPVDEGDLWRRMGDVGRRDEVQVLAQAFDHMLERLEDAFERQRAFVADASHELRTPLTVIRGQLEVLGMQEDPSADDVRRVERLVRTEVDRMGRLVEDLLLLDRSRREGFLRRHPIDVPAFLSDVLEGLRGTTDRRFVLGPAPHVVLDADGDRIAQALRNLLANAVAHTQPGGLVRLGAEQHGERVRLIVDDDGRGIPADQRESVFDRFHRLDAGRSDGGAGLGLSIVRAIAEAHGGRAWVDASPEGGARAVIDLPLEPPADLGELSSSAQERPSRVDEARSMTNPSQEDQA